MTAMELVLLGDSCSGIAGHEHEANFRTVRQALLARTQAPRMLCYLGDHVSGYVESEDELRLQWRHFLEREFRPIGARFDPVFHIAGNHDAYDRMSHDVCAELLPIPGLKGVIGRKGLNYAVRHEDSLVVLLNTADPSNYGRATLDLAWLEQALVAGKDAPVKLVLGHHPIHAVNGYDEHPNWRIPPEAGSEAWSLMRRFGVQAYLCSHIIAFDFQIRDGIVQLCTGGAGTAYGPGGTMPGETEYLHFVECAVSPKTFGYRVFDKSGACRERLAWPADDGDAGEAVTLLPGKRRASALPSGDEGRSGFFARWRIRGPMPAGDASIALVTGWKAEGARPALGISWDRGRVALRTAPGERRPEGLWIGPALAPGRQTELEVAVHSGGGPGGVMARIGVGEWSSLDTASPHGLEGMSWPTLWEASADPWQGMESLVIEMRRHTLP